MAASANPSGDNNQQDGVSNGNGATTNGISVPENSVVGPTQAALRHNPGLCVEWTPEEQTLLQDLLAKSVLSLSLSVIYSMYLYNFICASIIMRVYQCMDQFSA